MFAPLLAGASWLHQESLLGEEDEAKMSLTETTKVGLMVGACFIISEPRTSELKEALRNSFKSIGARYVEVLVSSSLQLPAAALQLANAGATIVVAVHQYDPNGQLPLLLTTISAGCGTPIIQAAYWEGDGYDFDANGTTEYKFALCFTLPRDP